MKIFTKISLYSLLIVLLATSSVRMIASSGRSVAPAPHKPVARFQPTPPKMAVRMFQAAQTVEVGLDVERPDMSARIVITNIIGKQVKIERVELSSGENTLRLDVADLIQGTYIIQVVGNTFTSEARKFIKANP